VGAPVSVFGINFLDPVDVQYNGEDARILASSDDVISTQVPPGATTGPITVVTGLGTATSAEAFFVGEAPIVSAAMPDSGKVGTHVTILGEHFNATTKVVFGGHGSASFVVTSDTSIEAIVDDGATTGFISVTTPAATGISAFSFYVIPPDPYPHLVAVRDVPYDQGGKVGVAWLASELDRPKFKYITGYRVWRRLNVPSASAQLGIGPPAFLTRRGTSAADGTIATTFWESVAEQPAVFLDGYAYAAATLQDSTDAANPFTAFFIQALTTDAYTFYNSEIDSGYSVDNFAPSRPSPFVGVYGIGAVALHWGANLEKDVAGYRLYKGGSTDFVPSTSNLLVSKADTGYVDFAGTLRDYYKLSAIDIHGNESRFALVMPTGPTDALASLVSVTYQARLVKLTWSAAANPGLVATVYRRTDGSDWSSVAQIVASGTGLLTYSDASVVPGQRYGYRLGIVDGGKEVFAGEAWFDVPQLTLAIKGAQPNPSTGDLLIEFSLPSAAPATLDLLDMTGRRLFTRGVGALGAGAHVIRIDEARGLASGVYVARLEQGGRHVSVKAVLVH
jgi:hypothetical protein